MNIQQEIIDLEKQLSAKRRELARETVSNRQEAVAAIANLVKIIKESHKQACDLSEEYSIPYRVETDDGEMSFDTSWKDSSCY